jgi:hypothetical protein
MLMRIFDRGLAFHFYADPTFHYDANPDPTFQFDVDPDFITHFFPDLDPPAPKSM